MGRGLLALGALAAMGLPGLAVFVSEFMSIMGGYAAFPVRASWRPWGSYSRRCTCSTCWPALSSVRIGRPAYEGATDAGPVEMAAVVPLAVLLVVLGIFPALLVSVQRPAVEAVLSVIGGG